MSSFVPLGSVLRTWTGNRAVLAWCFLGLDDVPGTAWIWGSGGGDWWHLHQCSQVFEMFAELGSNSERVIGLVLSYESL